LPPSDLLSLGILSANLSLHNLVAFYINVYKLTRNIAYSTLNQMTILTPASKENHMEKLFEEVERCQSCGLCNVRKKIVLGEGGLDSPVVLIGEAPGRKEDEQGRPFVGLAGLLLDKLLAEVGLERKDVYITNIVKCRPPRNRRPKAEEMKKCAVHLEKQLDIISPKVLTPMGNSASGYMMKRFNRDRNNIGKIHGKNYHIEAPWGKIVMLPIYHPAAVLYNRRLEEELKRDLETLKKLIRQLNVKGS
jgi:DNA polymerase